MSHAKEIGIALAAKLAQISIANGFATDIGLRTFRGKLKLDESAIPCVILVEGDDTRKDEISGRRTAQVLVEQRYDAEGHVECDPDNPNDAAHDVLADLKRAIFRDDLHLGGKIRAINYEGRVISPRLDGTKLVSASITIKVTYAENLAEP